MKFLKGHVYVVRFHNLTNCTFVRTYVRTHAHELACASPLYTTQQGSQTRPAVTVPQQCGKDPPTTPHPLTNQPHPPISSTYQSASLTNQPHLSMTPTHQSAPPTNHPYPPITPTRQSSPPANHPHPPISSTHQSAPPIKQPHPPINPTHRSAAQCSRDLGHSWCPPPS